MTKKKKTTKTSADASTPEAETPEEARPEQTALEQERDELLDKLQRLGADYANFQRRVPKQVADAVAYEREKILKSLLPVLDGFNHALENAASAANVEAIATGLRIVYDQMADVLKSHGVEPIQAQGQPFDPSRHEAMLRQCDPEREDNTVLQEFQCGYLLHERVLRPSKVVVNKHEGPAEADAPSVPSAEACDESEES